MPGDARGQPADFFSDLIDQISHYFYLIHAVLRWLKSGLNDALTVPAGVATRICAAQRDGLRGGVPSTCGAPWLCTVL